MPREAEFQQLGLTQGEIVVGMGVLTDQCCLVIGTHRGQVKRVKAEDVTSTAEASWAIVAGLAGQDDGVLFAGTGGEEAQVMFFGTSRSNRFSAAEVAPQATRSARGVSGIKLRKGDRLLGGAVIDPAADLAVVVVSRKGFVKRVLLKEFPVQGRAGQGVLLLNQTESTGAVMAVGTGLRDGSVDLIASDGKRQRVAEIPLTNRANRGEKLVELDEVVGVAVL